MQKLGWYFLLFEKNKKFKTSIHIVDMDSLNIEKKLRNILHKSSSINLYFL
jgi:hypothetical protein